jgi:hypothetical protein
VGLILCLAAGAAVDGVDLGLIGWTFTGVAALGLVVGLITNAQRSRHTGEKSVHDYVSTDRRPNHTRWHAWGMCRFRG